MASLKKLDVFMNQQFWNILFNIEPVFNLRFMWFKCLMKSLYVLLPVENYIPFGSFQTSYDVRVQIYDRKYETSVTIINWQSKNEFNRSKDKKQNGIHAVDQPVSPTCNILLIYQNFYLNVILHLNCLLVLTLVRSWTIRRFNFRI